ncbi:MAG: hypothetical protein AB7P04_08640 [Bacteriovoracia bacterium]
MRRWKLLAGIFFISTLAPDSPPSQADEAKRFFLCRFGPEIHFVAKRHNKPGSCEGSVNIQVKRWNCTTLKDVANETREFLKSITEMGAEQCRQHCAERGAGCESKFIKPLHCGFSVPQMHAAGVGKNAGCHDGCDGTAFAYCSLYHDGYVQTNPARVEKMTPNCTCFRKK